MEGMLPFVARESGAVSVAGSSKRIPPAQQRREAAEEGQYPFFLFYYLPRNAGRHVNAPISWPHCADDNFH